MDALRPSESDGHGAGAAARTAPGAAATSDGPHLTARTAGKRGEHRKPTLRLAFAYGARGFVVHPAHQAKPLERMGTGGAGIFI